ncbi:hypothetical protein K2173_019301 [Erythroxylum novogranatense]|uniref:GTD-binding domain-containing protein n=1 Tax=Erythroxylum novogranatense TaxID=1862640 RepID=A0AAV8STE3_9ROSI|nr:hypothetical protein K2173_019301 [Erythroxylum novogranatense]
MAFQQIEAWTFAGLVGAFLDLSITYLLLCASALAYFTSKFLGLFGLRLPCPCNGLFGDPHRHNCWQRVLVDRPSEHIASVQCCVKKRFPFDSIWEKNLRSPLDGNLISDCNNTNECVGLEDEVGVEDGVICVEGVKEGRSHAEGKQVLTRKAGSDLRRRRKGSLHNGGLSSFSSYEPLQSDEQSHPESPTGGLRIVNNSSGGNDDPSCSAVDVLHCGEESSMGVNMSERVTSFFVPMEPGTENKLIENVVLDQQEEFYNDDTVEDRITLLEQALEEEHAARAVLYLELEKERNAAATAADEAMAMILRLQQEKAKIEMESRQYQRMIEEKSAYDFEEMNILKEILLRREQEKHYLEQEVEAYRQLIVGNEQSAYDVQEMQSMHVKRASWLSNSSGDIIATLHTINESTSEKEQVEDLNKYLACKVEADELGFGKELSIPGLDEVESLKQGSMDRPSRNERSEKHFSSGTDEINKAFQDKGLVSVSPNTNTLNQVMDVQEQEACSQFNFSNSHQNVLHEETSPSVREVQKQRDNISPLQGLSLETTETSARTEIDLPCSFDDSERQKKDSCSDLSHPGPYAYDVHVVDDQSNVCSVVNQIEDEKLPGSPPLAIPIPCDSPITSKGGVKQEMSRSCSDIITDLPPIHSLQSKRMLSDLRRNSMSAVDYERFKIDNEVGWLRERLRIVQSGREKLNISMGYMQKEKDLLKLLENVVSQLQEIRRVKEDGKCGRQASLPHPPSKVISNKKQWRSVSMGMHRSS